jgi:putative hydroxymethylpyrimidine transporter CytX
MGALLLLTIILSTGLYSDSAAAALPGEPLSFALALELSIAMPLSWLPLISDYTRKAAEPIKATAVSTVIYGLVSCWMYMIGLGAALTFGESDIAQVMAKSGLGIAGLVIILLSTVTTTFLDAYSAGVSSKSAASRLNEKSVALLVTILGTAGAISLPLLDFTEFLYFIGSVFAPMIAIQLADYFITGRHYEQTSFSRHNLFLWLVGFLLYRLLMQADLAIGSTLPAMLMTMTLCVAVNALRPQHKPIEAEVH